MTREELIEAMVRRMAESECGPTSLYGYASAALAALEATGVRLVPVDPTWPIIKTAQCSIEAYDKMIALSPYALPGG